MKKLLKKQDGFSAIEAVLILVLFVVIAAVGMYVLKNRSTATSNTAPATVTKLKSNVCYINLADKQLDCVNSQGKNKVTYILPKSGNNPTYTLKPNFDSTQFLASTEGMVILDSKLDLAKELNFPSGLTNNPATASWSHDGKSIFIELGSDSNQRHVYKYEISTGSVTKLTSQGYNTSPFETKDGRIVYTYFSGTSDGSDIGWVPYIMDSDGSNKKPFSYFSDTSVYSDRFAGLSYDAKTDSVFVASFPADGSVGKGKLAYETVDDLVRGVKPKTISLDVQTSGDDSVLRINNSTILWMDNVAPNETSGQIISLSDGSIKYTIPNYGNPVGVLTSTSNFKK